MNDFFAHHLAARVAWWALTALITIVFIRYAIKLLNGYSTLMRRLERIAKIEPELPVRSFPPDSRPTIYMSVPTISGMPCVRWDPKEAVLYVFVPETFKIVAVPVDSGLELRPQVVGSTLDVVPYRVGPAPTIQRPSR